MRSTIICVDDEKVLLNVLAEQLESWFGGNYVIEKALSGAECLEIIDNCIEKKRDVSVVISDYIMPVMKGDELLEKVKERDPKIKKIMLTGYSSIEGIIRAINKAGLYRFILKPWDNKDLMLTLLEAIKSYEHEKLTIDLAHKYEALNAKYQAMEEVATKSVNSIVEVLATAADTRALTSEGHSKRVAQYAGFMGKALKLNEEEQKSLVQEALLHDVGKIILSDQELKEVRENKAINNSSTEIRIKQIESTKRLLQFMPDFDELFGTLKYQFEEYCGSGPYNMVGEKIPLHARIIAIANEFDFLKNKTEKHSLDEIVKFFEDCKETLYDPKLVDIFIKLIRPTIND